MLSGGVCEDRLINTKQKDDLTMTDTPAHALVWGEIPVRDLDRSIAFYETVMQYKITRDDNGPNPIGMLPFEGDSIAGHLYPGEPAAPGTGPTLHLAVPDSLEATAARCEQAGGTLKSDAITIPPGRFIYAEDPDGNSLGLFEAAKA